ncbi:hypothetical protein GJ496_003841 [Pomphorhynchus laevis]|nr:hypothetical protein GJ496_003841 [Pomphorhynchus laevis]
MHLDWSKELWDQFDNLAYYTNRGASFCDSLEYFFRERCNIEQDYASKLRRLARSVLNRRRDDRDFYQTMSFTQAFHKIVKEHEDIASQHELIAEHIRERVIDDIQTLTKMIREQKRRSCEENNRNKKVLAKSAEVMNKGLRRYEDAFDVSRKACDNYQKANEDINLSRAQVEKARLVMVEKNTLCEQTKQDYFTTVERYNISKAQFYDLHSPQILKELQNFDETRINKVRSCLDTYIQCHEEVLHRIKSCMDEMLNASSSISFTSDSQKIVEVFHSGYNQPADEVPIDYSLSDDSTSRLSCDNFTNQLNHTPSINGTMKRYRFGTLMRVKNILKGRKKFDCDAISEHHLSKLPPAQRLRRHKQIISNLEQQLSTKQLERQGLLKMQRIYNENPNFGEEFAVDEKLKQTNKDIALISDEIKNEQIQITELMDNLSISKSTIEHWSASSQNLSSSNDHNHLVEEYSLAPVNNK